MRSLAVLLLAVLLVGCELPDDGDEVSAERQAVINAEVASAVHFVGTTDDNDALPPLGPEPEEDGADDPVGGETMPGAVLPEGAPDQDPQTGPVEAADPETGATQSPPHEVPTAVVPTPEEVPDAPGAETGSLSEPATVYRGRRRIFSGRVFGRRFRGGG